MSEHFIGLSDKRVITETYGNAFPETFTLAEAFVRHQEAVALPRDFIAALYGGHFAEIHSNAVDKTHHPVDPHKLHFMWQLCMAAPKGPMCEAGVFRGGSATVLELYTDDLHLVDSFEGFAKVTIQDALHSDGETATCAWGEFQWDADKVRRMLPSAAVHKGWIPEVLEELPEQKWAFVHMDVDLFEPTYHCAQYFLPRMMPGGIIVEDQYISVVYPGAGRAWGQLNVPLLTLPTGQGVLIA